MLTMVVSTSELKINIYKVTMAIYTYGNMLIIFYR